MRITLFFFLLLLRAPPRSTLFLYTTLFRSRRRIEAQHRGAFLPRPIRPLHRKQIACGALDIRGRQEPEVVHPLYGRGRSEEHTSELQSLTNLVCRLLLEKKKENADQKIDIA